MRLRLFARISMHSPHNRCACTRRGDDLAGFPSPGCYYANHLAVDKLPGAPSQGNYSSVAESRSMFAARSAIRDHVLSGVHLFRLKILKLNPYSLHTKADPCLRGPVHNGPRFVTELGSEIIALGPAFCSPLKGVGFVGSNPQATASSGLLNQNPT